jgi:hypothetical protein
MPADILVGMDWIRRNIKLIDVEADEQKRLDEVLTFKDNVKLEDEVIEIKTQAQADQLMDEALHIAMISVTFDEEGCYEATVAAVDKRDLLMDKIERITWHGKLGQDISLDLPEEYREFAEVFSMEAAKRLPDHRNEFDCQIELEPGKQPPVGRLFQLSQSELQTLQEYLHEMLETGKIRPSRSAAAASCFFVPKPHGRGLRFVVDYRGLNAMTFKDKYPLPLMDELLEHASKAKIYTKIDLKNGFNNIRIANGHEWKTAFRTRYGSYEYLVMPFGLTNAPSTFQRLMDHVLAGLIDKGVIVYIDDILIYSDNLEDHIKMVREVLARLQKHKLAAELEKCSFHVQEVEFLGHILNGKGMRMEEAKIKEIVEWPTPRSVKEVQSFLGFCNFYRRFIRHFARIARPIHDLTKKGVQFEWSPRCQAAFDSLKEKVTSAPILVAFNFSKPHMIETDASDLAMSGILNQLEDDGKWHPCAFMSKSFIPAQINYDVHDKEMLAIVKAFQEWEHLLIGSPQSIIVYTDHANLQYFNTTKVLNRRQCRWSDYLSQFDFKIIYRPGTQNGKADALSRRADPALEGGSGAMQFFKPGQLVLFEGDEKLLDTDSIAAISTREKPVNSQWVKELKEAAIDDPEYQTRLKRASGESSVCPCTGVCCCADYSISQLGLLLFKRKIYIPDDVNQKLKIVKDHHDTKVAGHFGRDKTYELIKRNFWFPGLEPFIRKYVSSCDICQRNKARRHKPYGELNSLEVPYTPWSHISMDFIVDLPNVNGYTIIWVVVDRFSKMAHFIPLKSTQTSELVKAFIQYIWKYHGLPVNIVSDRDPTFTSRFWMALMRALEVDLSLSTAYHPRTDGQTERLNQILEQYLRCFSNYLQDNWLELLHFAEFAYNNAEHSVTKMSPFYACTGQHPRALLIGNEEIKTPSAAEWVKDMEEIQEELRKNLLVAQQRAAKSFNKKVIPGPDFKVGDLVLLNANNIKTKRQSKKLDNLFRGPCELLSQLDLTRTS